MRDENISEKFVNDLQNSYARRPADKARTDRGLRADAVVYRCVPEHARGKGNLGMPRLTSTKECILEYRMPMTFKRSDCRRFCVFLLVAACHLQRRTPRTAQTRSAKSSLLKLPGKPTVLVTSGEHYGAVVNLDFDYLTYLEELQRNHLNLTRMFSAATGRSTSRMIPSRAGTPSTGIRSRPKGAVCFSLESTVQANGTVKFDLHRWNPRYFDRLHDFLREAGKRGVVVELSLFCLMYDQSLWEASPLNSRNNGNQTEDVPNTEVYNLQHPRLQEAEDNLVRKLVAETRQFDNLYFEVINEPYWHSVTPQWQRHITDLIRESESSAGVVISFLRTTRIFRASQRPRSECFSF
jgi:hypothetical protein